MPERTKNATRIGWIYDWKGTPARVLGWVATVEGWYVNLREPDSDASLGNVPIGQLGRRWPR